MSGDNLTGHRQNQELSHGDAAPNSSHRSSENKHIPNSVKSRLNILNTRKIAHTQTFILALLFATVLGAVDCSGDDGAGGDLPGFVSIPAPTVALEHELLIEVGEADYRGCTGLVELGDVARAAGLKLS